MIAFFTCQFCKAKDVPVENIFPQRRSETEQQYLYRVFKLVGEVHDHRSCSNRLIQISIPEPDQQKDLGAA